MPGAWLYRAPAVCLLVLLTATTAYRAFTQSITHDEAFTYSVFVATPFWTLFQTYEANNHLLYTLLAKASTSLLGAGEFGLRIPAVCAAGLLFWRLYRISARVYGCTWWLPFSLAVVALNAYLLDLLSLARGYGLACALLVLALDLLLEDRARWWQAGVAAGLAVTANLTWLFPVSGLTGGLLWRDRRGAVWFGLTWMVLASGLMAGPLMLAGRGSFYYGSEHWSESLLSLAGVSVRHNVNARDPAVMAGGVVIGAVLAAAVFTGLRVRRRDAPLDRLLYLVGATTAGAAVLIGAARVLAGIPYPFGRTGLYLLVLFGLSVAALARYWWKWGGLAFLAAAAGALVASGSTWTMSGTADWEYDAGTRRIIERVASLRRPGEKVSLGASWVAAPSLNYYREIRGWEWLRPVSGEGPRAGQFDLYVLVGDDQALVEERGLRVLYVDPYSRVVLARRRP